MQNTVVTPVCALALARCAKNADDEGGCNAACCVHRLGPSEAKHTTQRRKRS
eukprot:COSAG04_NODE_25630_length_305_cov_0.747573_1_plen_51_part_10